MSQSVPDLTTAIITILFLFVLAIIGFVIKIKSGTLKKIIKKDEVLDVLHQSSLRNGYISYIFKVGEEKFFFVGHKSGRSSLTQVITKNISEVKLENRNVNNTSENIIKKKTKSII